MPCKKRPYRTRTRDKAAIYSRQFDKNRLNARLTQLIRHYWNATTRLMLTLNLHFSRYGHAMPFNIFSITTHAYRSRRRHFLHIDWAAIIYFCELHWLKFPGWRRKYFIKSRRVMPISPLPVRLLIFLMPIGSNASAAIGLMTAQSSEYFDISRINWPAELALKKVDFIHSNEVTYLVIVAMTTFWEIANIYSRLIIFTYLVSALDNTSLCCKWRIALVHHYISDWKWFWQSFPFISYIGGHYSSRIISSSWGTRPPTMSLIILSF